MLKQLILKTKLRFLSRGFEDYHGVYLHLVLVLHLKGLKSTGTAEFNKVWSYLGTPCISLPLLEGENKLPLGVQLIGDRYDDHRFLGVAKWLEKECNNKMNKITTLLGSLLLLLF
jgi:hypothetical protein